jgi:hypothetical protein
VEWTVEGRRGGCGERRRRSRSSTWIASALISRPVYCDRHRASGRQAALKPSCKAACAQSDFLHPAAANLPAHVQ